MRVNGIIAEYNPFHNGHQYQLEESRCLTGADFTVIVMSGDFVQRGAPALLEKRVRAEMALRCGADLVLELPVLYATASSEYFAAGAVALLHGIGVITHLCFGSECGEIGPLRQTAALLLEEPEKYRAALKEFLKQGRTYPEARAEALKACELLPPGCWELLASPNNILGTDYIKALLRLDSRITPVTVKRIGSGYHDGLPSAVSGCPASLTPGDSNSGVPPISALAIRQLLQNSESTARLSACMPAEALRLLGLHPNGGVFVRPDDFSALLYYKLLLEREQGYEKYLDVTTELSNRIRKQLKGFTGFEAFCDILKTRDMTYTRISRCLLHILLDIEQTQLPSGEVPAVPYARVLGFRKSARSLLTAVKNQTSVPVITKLSTAQKNLPEQAGRLLRQDILASEIYKGIAYKNSGRPARGEFSEPLLIL